MHTSYVHMHTYIYMYNLKNILFSVCIQYSTLHRNSHFKNLSQRRTFFFLCFLNEIIRSVQKVEIFKQLDLRCVFFARKHDLLVIFEFFFPPFFPLLFLLLSRMIFFVYCYLCSRVIDRVNFRMDS